MTNIFYPPYTIGDFPQSTSITPQPTIVNTYPTTFVGTTSKTQSLGNSFKPKKAGKNGAHIVLVLDDSSSMQAIKTQTLEGLNEFIETQKLEASKIDLQTHLSLYKFNGSDVICTIDHQNIHTIEKLTEKDYNPRGMTNLLDAIGGVIMNTNKIFEGLKKKKREAVTITVFTDGQENSSKICSRSDVKQMVSKCEEKNWGFNFIGANIDSFATGSTLGFDKSSILQYDTANMSATMRNASAKVTRMNQAYASGMSTAEANMTTAFTDEERSTSMNGDT